MYYVGRPTCRSKLSRVRGGRLIKCKWDSGRRRDLVNLLAYSELCTVARSQGYGKSRALLYNLLAYFGATHNGEMHGLLDAAGLALCGKHQLQSIHCYREIVVTPYLS